MKPLCRAIRIGMLAGFLNLVLVALPLAAQGPINPRTDQAAPPPPEKAKEPGSPGFSTFMKETPTKAGNVGPDSVAKQCRVQFENAQREWKDRLATMLKGARTKDDTIQIANDFGTLESFGCVWRRLRLSNPAMAKEYFGGLEVGNAVALSLGQNKNATLYTELFSDNIWTIAKLGYARLGFGAQVAASKDTSKSTADQFFQGGGNAVMYAAVPSLVWINHVSSSSKPVAIRRYDSFFTFALGADVPSMSTPAAKNAWNGRFGYQANFLWNADEEVFRIFARGNAGIATGSKVFFQNLQADSTAQSGLLGLIRGVVGVDLAKRFRIGVSAGGSTRKGVRQKPSLSVELLSQ